MLERKRRFANAEKAVLEVRIGGMKFCGAFGISRGLCTGRPTRTRVAPPRPLNHIQHFPDSCSRFFATLFLHTTPDCVGGCSLPSTPSSSPFTSSPLPSLSILPFLDCVANVQNRLLLHQREGASRKKTSRSSSPERRARRTI